MTSNQIRMHEMMQINLIFLGASMNLTDIRKQIDEIDEQLIELLNQRARFAQEVGMHKERTRAHYFTPEREEIVYKRVQSLNNGPLSNEAVRNIYREIISASRALEKPLKIAYLGPEGTYSHYASLLKFGGCAEYVPVDSITEIFAYVERGYADYGVVPVENSQAGVIPETLDTFMESNMHIVSELYIPVIVNLASHYTNLNDIKVVFSHPQPKAQCKLWLRSNLPNAEVIETPSTSRAAEMAAQTPDSAALCPRIAAERSNLPILVEHTEDNPGNRTRFIVLGYNEPDKTGQDKTSIMFSLHHQSGELYKAIGAFEKYDVNMTMIESRPARLGGWEYMFYVDIQGHIKDAQVAKAIDMLSSHARFLRLLGSYPAAE